MKYKNLIVIYLCFFLNSRLDKNHTRQNKILEMSHQKTTKFKLYKKCPLNSKEIAIHPEDPICFDDIIIDKVLLYFSEFYPITILEFMTKIIDKNCIIEEKKAEFKSNIINLMPDQVWDFLNNTTYFNTHLITALNYLFCAESFHLLYQTRLTIEYLIFAFNTKEKKTVFPYVYTHKLRLKGILHTIENFINEYEEKFEENLSKEQIDSFKQFLHKYIAMSPKNINYMTFLQELSSFKNFIATFSDTRNGETKDLNVFEKMSIMRRFSSIIKI